MFRGRGWKTGLTILGVIVMAFSFGCAKKQAVKSTETAAPPAASAPAAPSTGKTQEGVVTETLKPEAGKTAPAESAGTRVAAAEAAAGVAATEEKASPFKDIHFDFDKSAIREDAKPVLAAVADYMKKNKGAKLVIEGHCDERGTAEYNMALGDRRAESARKYLASLGVQAAVLSTVSYGKEKPLDPGHNEDAWAKNRRDHFVVK